ncbi:hypothetical protein M878_01835 [Streptomyces roseochromogenus subsp. oscitans DS 12.976]|uniref:Uncharacterized protein n=1 Tax=Streptomyces roseochromogenus subsp. oscitans DS 12.976 TaxID=1352936 RepID=V6L5E8_STRRC|nr:hypothetical protein M878_01835 [Streptomyces roseochromogenus subsp. oscitans DS 12.976]
MFSASLTRAATRDAEPAPREQADDEVVLAPSGGGDDEVAGQRARALQQYELARVLGLWGRSRTYARKVIAEETSSTTAKRSVNWATSRRCTCPRLTPGSSLEP